MRVPHLDRNGAVVPVLDMARAHMALLESLSVHKAHALVGASLGTNTAALSFVTLQCSVSDADPLTGGCVALSFASEYPDFVDNLCVISCTGMAIRLWAQSGDTQPFLPAQHNRQINAGECGLAAHSEAGRAEGP